MKRSSVAIALTLCLVSSAVWAHGKATGIVRERMDDMIVLKDSMKLLKAELSNGEAYDAALVISAAKNIQDHAGAALTVKFPEGSLTKHSEALPSVWNDPDLFAAIALEMERLAGDLTASVEAGVPNVQSSDDLFAWLSAGDDPVEGALRSPYDTFGAIADTCRNCHKEYRKE